MTRILTVFEPIQPVDDTYVYDPNGRNGDIPYNNLVKVEWWEDSVLRIS